MQCLRSTLSRQDIGALVENLLADVPRPSRDLELPAKTRAKTGSQLRTMPEVPQAACKPMGPLRHRIIHPRQVGSIGITVRVAEQDHEATLEISS